MPTRAYLLATAERAIKTAVQTALALIGTDAAGVASLDWSTIGSTVALAVLVSLLTSLGGIKLSPGAGPAAFGPEAVVEQPARGANGSAPGRHG